MIWSLAWEALNGTMDETYPEIDNKTGVVERTTTYPYEDDGLDYEVDLSAIDDQYAHHFIPTEKKMALLF